MQEAAIAPRPGTDTSAAATQVPPTPAAAVRRTRGVGYVFKDKRSGGVIFGIAYTDVDGRLRKERTRAKSMTLAKRILADRQDAVERAQLQGLPSVDALLSPAPAVTLRQFSKEYLTHAKATLAKTSLDRAEVIFESHLLPTLGGLVLTRINAGDVQKYSDARLEAGAAPATVQRELMVLSGLFREARKRELLDRNPVSLVKKPTVDNKIVRYLDSEEEKELLARLPEPLRSAVIAAIHSGLREREETNLTWSDIRLKERVLVVRKTKSNRDRVIPMSQTLYELLKEMPRHIKSPYVFTNTDTGTKYDRFNNTTWRAALVAAGIHSFRWHDLRHTFCSRLAQAGVHPVAIKDLAGHSDLRVTSRYMHLAPAKLRTAVQALDGAKVAPITTHGATQPDVDTGKAAG